MGYFFIKVVYSEVTLPAPGDVHADLNEKSV